MLKNPFHGLTQVFSQVELDIRFLFQAIHCFKTPPCLYQNWLTTRCQSCQNILFCVANQVTSV